MTSKSSICSFSPLLERDSRVLILGTMPSQISLAKDEYYANPRNCFWWLMSELCDFDMQISYLEKIAAIQAKGIALWDVLQECERSGSLDAKIERASEKVNDFQELLRSHQNIELICFNGVAAMQIFMRHLPELNCAHNNLSLQRLPSTSPAHAAMTKHKKLELWGGIISPYLVPN